MVASGSYMSRYSGLLSVRQKRSICLRKPASHPFCRQPRQIWRAVWTIFHAIKFLFFSNTTVFRTIKLDDGSEVLLLSIPRFTESNTVVMLNMKTLKTHPMVFDYMSNWSLREMSLIANSIYELSLLVLRKSLSISIEKQADTGGILCIYLATHLKSN